MLPEDLFCELLIGLHLCTWIWVVEKNMYSIEIFSKGHTILFGIDIVSLYIMADFNSYRQNYGYHFHACVELWVTFYHMWAELWVTFLQI